MYKFERSGAHSPPFNQKIPFTQTLTFNLTLFPVDHWSGCREEEEEGNKPSFPSQSWVRSEFSTFDLIWAHLSELDLIWAHLSGLDLIWAHFGSISILWMCWKEVDGCVRTSGQGGRMASTGNQPFDCRTECTPPPSSTFQKLLLQVQPSQKLLQVQPFEKTGRPLLVNKYIWHIALPLFTMDRKINLFMFSNLFAFLFANH